jgi:poly-gamma-glutamate synthesis protein (capsule biosynthesis protein)
MLKINIAGDFFIASKFFNDSNLLSVGDRLKRLLDESDLNILNLEAPIITSPSSAEKYGPCLSMDKRVLETLKLLNINLVTLANNHILDHQADGLISTLNFLEGNEIKYLGAGKNNLRATEPYIIRHNDISVGFLNFAENEFSNTYGEQAGAAPLDLIENTLNLQSLKSKVDKVIVIVHGGAELHKYPSPRFKKLLEYFSLQGADAVIAHHTHRYNGFRIFNDVPIVYGTGNFIFPIKGMKNDWNIGVVANLLIEKQGPIRLKVVPIELIYQENKLILKDLDKNEFAALENDLNDKLGNDDLLAKEYISFIERNEQQYRHFLQPFTSKYLHKLFSMGLIPDFLNNKVKKMLYLNLVRCEAHRDVLLNILSK